MLGRRHEIDRTSRPIGEMIDKRRLVGVVDSTDR
jgi:hypothetical protein